MVSFGLQAYLALTTTDMISSCNPKILLNVGRDADSLAPMGTIINRQGTRGEAVEWPRSDIVDHYESTLRGRDVN